MYELWRQCSAIVFFVDWEKPRHQGDGDTGKLASVNMWRRVLIAREWVGLQAHQYVGTVYVLMAMLLFLLGCQWRNLAVPTPSFELSASEATNPLLLFSIDSLVWLLSWLALFICRRFLDRLYRDRLLQFVDFASLCNVSIILIDRPLHGYYIHGRSVHPYADASMPEMINFLSREAGDLVAKRGLQSTEQQTFEVYTNFGFHNSYERLFSVVKNMYNSRDRFGGKTGDGSDQILAKSFDAINKLLRNFVENVCHVLNIDE